MVKRQYVKWIFRVVGKTRNSARIRLEFGGAWNTAIDDIVLLHVILIFTPKINYKFHYVNSLSLHRGVGGTTIIIANTTTTTITENF